MTGNEYFNAEDLKLLNALQKTREERDEMLKSAIDNNRLEETTILTELQSLREKRDEQLKEAIETHRNNRRTRAMNDNTLLNEVIEYNKFRENAKKLLSDDSILIEESLLEQTLVSLFKEKSDVHDFAAFGRCNKLCLILEMYVVGKKTNVFIEITPAQIVWERHQYQMNFLYKIGKLEYEKGFLERLFQATFTDVVIEKIIKLVTSALGWFLIKILLEHWISLILSDQIRSLLTQSSESVKIDGNKISVDIEKIAALVAMEQLKYAAFNPQLKSLFGDRDVQLDKLGAVHKISFNRHGMEVECRVSDTFKDHLKQKIIMDDPLKLNMP